MDIINYLTKKNSKWKTTARSRTLKRKGQRTALRTPIGSKAKHSTYNKFQIRVNLRWLPKLPLTKPASLKNQSLIIIFYRISKTERTTEITPMKTKTKKSNIKTKIFLRWLPECYNLKWWRALKRRTKVITSLQTQTKNGR